MLTDEITIDFVEFCRAWQETAVRPQKAIRPTANSLGVDMSNITLAIHEAPKELWNAIKVRAKHCKDPAPLLKCLKEIMDLRECYLDAAPALARTALENWNKGEKK